jgi:AraC family transcriptional regulator, transcriptional activator of pobA
VMITQYDFFRTKYGEELLIDLIHLEDLDKYIKLSPVQRLSYYDITVIRDGNGTFAIDDHEQVLEQGSVFFSSPGQIRKWNTTKTPQGYVLIFEDEFLCTFFNDRQFVHNLPYYNLSDNPPVLQLGPNDYNQLTILLKEIQTEISYFKNNDKHILRALLYQILVLLSRKFISAYPASQKKPINNYVNRFIQLIDTNHHQYRAVDYYARQLHITSGHLNSLVKDYFGINVKKYILNKNILEAKRMLQHTDMTVGQIADCLNYENTTYFVRTFRSHTNMTPLSFRNQANP